MESSSSCHRFSFVDILQATEEFAPKNYLGYGAFGEVYRGNISEKDVAVKRMNMNPEQGIPAFHKEIDLLSACDQVNIISLVGYCDEGDEKILVYEYMPNGSLYDYLYLRQDVINPRLTVEQRLEICIGVAKGLTYLHSGTHFNIIHSDIKCDNILLDRNMVPKISDFGLSRTRDVGSSASQVITNNIKGTEGYLAPECYEPNYKLSRKADIYAFGVVFLEVLCERQPSRRLLMLALPFIMRGELHKFTPEHVETSTSPECLRECENLIKDCLDNDPKKRPFINQVVDRLELALEMQKQQTSSHDQQAASELPLTISEAFSSGINDRIVLFYTSSGVVVETQGACQEARQILDGYGKRVDERDVYLVPTYRKQMQDVFGTSWYTLPQLFVGGKYIGGEDEIRKLHWSGELRKKLHRLPKRDYPSFCTSCGNTRFVSLSWCPACSFWKSDTIWFKEPEKYSPKV
ncbi:hypothetical protein SSX86_003318 [Deinandra increscens subsp. villosa]|uniref:non-specific serine/threonine protein kinase n=1 Tax=Deinandra increscens subsp. villosa TaxID=3103831 RepID=A0AAP0H6N9_9ASTR